TGGEEAATEVRGSGLMTCRPTGARRTGSRPDRPLASYGPPLQPPRLDRGEDRLRITPPGLRIGIDVQLDLVPVGVPQVEALADGMIAHPRDRHPRPVQLRLGGAQGFERVADLDADVVEAES